LAVVKLKAIEQPATSIGAKKLVGVGRFARAGFRYSSSIYPVKHDLYGMPEAQGLSLSR